MSKHLVSLVYRKKIGSMMRKAVLSYMADRANDDGSGVWCSKGTIANEIEASRQGVITTIKSLVDDGLLIEDGQRKCQNGFTVEYRIDVKKVHALPFVTGKDLDTSKIGPVNAADVTCQPDVRDPSTPLTQTSQNHPEPSKKPAAQADAFEDAWKLYQSCPHKAGQTKKLAKAQWPKAVKRAGGSEIILKALASVVAKQRSAEGFVENLPDMHRWLSRDKWADAAAMAPPIASAEMTEAEWAISMRHWVETGDWLASEASPAPDQPGCKAPAKMLRHAARLRADLADRILANLKLGAAA
jgi:biotin operon repressor